MADQQNQKSIPLQYQACPTCHGFGYELSGLGRHINCPDCHNQDSLYGQLDRQVFYWGRPVNHLTIFQHRSQLFLKNFLNFLLIIIGVVGLLALLYSVYQVLAKHLPLATVFTGTNHRYLAFFWFSLLTDFFVYYRFELDLQKRKFIKGRAWDQKIKTSKSLPWAELHRDKEKIDIADYFSQESLRAVEQAHQNAAKLKHDEIRPIHLLIALMPFSQTSVIFGRLGIDIQKFTSKTAAVVAKQNKLLVGHGLEIDLGLDLKRALLLAYYEAFYHRRHKVGITELLLAIIQTDQLIFDVFYDLEIDLRKLHNVIEWIYIRKKLQTQWLHLRHRSAWKPKTHMNRALTARPTPILDSLGSDFTLRARSGGFFPLIGRAKEVGEAFRVLKEGQGNVLLVGESGAGKSTILQGIAELMTAEDVPKELQDKRLIVVDPGSLIAGAAGMGDLEKRMQDIIREIAIAGNVILAIEDIHNLLGAGSTGSGADVSTILMNALSQGYLHVLGTTTTPEFQQYIANKETFLRRFQVVKIPEMNQDEAIQVLEARSGTIEYKQKVYFSYDALEACVVLTTRYIQDRHLPAKALDIMEEAAIFAREQKGESALVTKEDVAKVLSEKTNVPLAAVTKTEAQKLLNLEEIMHRRLVGQDEAVQAVARALRRSREELRDVNRPIANFLFLGPTGVGKTETAKTIAEVYFGQETQMLRFDMSEYQDAASIYKLIGSPQSAGQFTEALRLKPFALVLLDELEKAHPDILNLFTGYG